MPYMIAPGARLEVGPRGKLYETMGDDPTFGQGLTNLTKIQHTLATSNLSAADTAAAKAAGLTITPDLIKKIAAQQAGTAAGAGGAAAMPVAPSPMRTVILIGAAAAAGLGALYLLRRKR